MRRALRNAAVSGLCCAAVAAISTASASRGNRSGGSAMRVVATITSAALAGSPGCLPSSAASRRVIAPTVASYPLRGPTTSVRWSAASRSALWTVPGVATHRRSAPGCPGDV